VFIHRPPVKVHCARTQPRPLGDPCRRILAEFHLLALALALALAAVAEAAED
jgi:hypothetical protein